eukprot:5095030-Prymnesium_polylepis.1
MMRACNRADTPMLTCVRTRFYGRTVPSAEGTLEGSPAAARSVKRRRATKASSRMVELIDGRNVGSVSNSPTRRASMDLCCRGTSSDQGTAAQLSSTGLRAYL